MKAAPYDVVIVGSGAGGGMAAYVLTKAGASVCVLEAGPEWYSMRDSAMLNPAYVSPRRGAATKSKHNGEWDGSIGGWDIEGEPYTVAKGTEFTWWRARVLGGRTNHWGRISLRFGPRDFKAKTFDGLGDDWPISYEDVAPYYEKVERLIGVYGSNEGLPNAPDSIFLPPPRPRCYELLIKKAADKLNVTCVPARQSILTRPLNGRAACHHCGQCGRGCQTNSNFSSPDVLIKPALKTGRLTLLTNAMAREVTVGKDGLANGVSYVDKKTGQDRHVSGRAVVLAASAFETVRILFNSRSAQHPQGLANQGGVLGKYITDTTATGVDAIVPQLMNFHRHNDDGGGSGYYMPWWLDNKKLDFPRGYHIEIGGGFSPPRYGFMRGIHEYNAAGGGFGKALKDDYRKYYGAMVYLDGRGEMIPNDDSYTELDPVVVDKWGIPVLRFHWKWQDYELNQVKHMQETFRAMVAEMGGTVTTPMPTKEEGYGIQIGGSVIHELGGARMGSDASSSSVNEWCQAHDCRNVFVADGAPFTSQADKNPTWTILALAWRTSEKIAQLRKEGAI
jgi:choline dehydrogenase-like flavoprotein